MVNYEYEELFRQDSIDKQISITGEDIDLGNDKIYQGSFSLEESLNTNDDLTFGSCVASQENFTTSDVESSFIGKILTTFETINNHTEEPLELGVFKVNEEKWTANRTKKEIVGYDRIYDINNMDVTDWYNSLTFPISLLNFRNSFFNYIGVEQVSASLINDTYMIPETILPKALSGSMVIQSLCAFNGVFGHITRDNKFKYIQLDTTSVYTITPAMYTECKYEDYTVKAIDKVIIRQEENDIGGSAGSGDNALIIQGNFLAYGASPETLTAVASNILSVVGSITYTPCEISCIGNPCVEIGDCITVVKRDGTSFNTFVLNRKLSNIQSMKDEISAMGNEYRVNEINSAENDWIQLLGKTNKLTRTVEETVSQVENLDGSVTTLTQTSDYLVSEVQNINRELNGENLTWQGEGEPTLLNYPYWDFTSAFKCDGTKKCAPIYNNDMTEVAEGETGEYPHFYYSEQDRIDHVRDLYIDLDNGNGYRFVKTNGVWNWQLIADSDFSILFNQITELRQDVDSIDLNVQNDEITIANHETRITHNESEITTQADLIRAKVSQTDHNGDNSFSWEMKTSGVKFTSNSTDVLTIGSTGIKIQGNAEFTGKITAKSGYIGNGSNGFTIGNINIYNGINSMDSTGDGIYIGTDGINLSGNAKLYRDGSVELSTTNDSELAMFRIKDVTTKDYIALASGRITLGNTSASHQAKQLYLSEGYVDSYNLRVGSTTGKPTVYGSTGIDLFSEVGMIKVLFGEDIISANKVFYIDGKLQVTGTKNRIVDTSQGKVGLNAVESAECYFCDMGSVECDKDGIAEVIIDSLFAETVDLNKPYVLNITQLTDNQGWVEKKKDRFVIHSKPKATFDWIIYCKQKDYSNVRLEKIGKVG